MSNTFPELDCTLPNVCSPRSQLIRLPPIGVGTARAEGLTSYLIRLAGAHSVSPKRLVRSVFAEVQPEIAAIITAGNFFSWGGRSINGLGRYADLFSETISTLTSVEELHFLTLLPLRHLLPPNSEGLLVRHPQWCPACFAEMAKMEEEAYSPLVWSFRLYRSCGIHRRPMVERCPACGRFQDFIPGYPHCDRCSHCLAWLGHGESPAMAISAAEKWTCVAIEELVSSLPALESAATWERFLHVLDAAIQIHSAGSLPRFCRDTGLGVSALRKWFAKCRPCFLQWLGVSYVLGILPSQFFVGADAGPAISSGLHRRPDFLKPQGQKPWLSDDDQKGLRVELRRIADDPGLVISLSALARQLLIDLGSLKYWAPEDCRKIRDRYAQTRQARAEQRRNSGALSVKMIVDALLERGEYPNVGKVNHELLKLSCCLVQPELRKAYKEAMLKYREDHAGGSPSRQDREEG